ncbi:2-amino-4-hydroxy-6-hydroxymethyldihydropteridine diphosphokinase [Acidobacteria bacterium ACD]|nr:MAG: 2-amino-4-hydroxy-6-hydroxymethyldihydropteridine diphosphokinase [Acidobacteriota bacterium]MDL1951232.1 2-amino-4-hydroxy-6-hydroxymethyldihydropteridine diphosphokinase [Acidobacteria bacterium ACD]
MAIGLGGNSDGTRRALSVAVASLSGTLDALRVSALYRTAPVGGPEQPDFWNAVAVGRTRLPARALLARLLRLERSLGRRRRGADRNGPRVLDLDLLLYGGATLDDRPLRVPHPRLFERRFVLAPLAELAPGWVVPGTGRSVASLLDAAPAARVEPAGRIA